MAGWGGRGRLHPAIRSATTFDRPYQQYDSQQYTPTPLVKSSRDRKPTDDWLLLPFLATHDDNINPVNLHKYKPAIYSYA